MWWSVDENIVAAAGFSNGTYCLLRADFVTYLYHNIQMFQSFFFTEESNFYMSLLM